MPTKKSDGSSTSIASARKSGKPIPQMQPRRDESSSKVQQEAGGSKPWSSRIREHFAEFGARLEWDNDLALRLARNVIRLRKHRSLTQADLAERMGTSQARIATIEAAGGNVTIRTIERLAEALQGRVAFSLEPAERTQARLPAWWTFDMPHLDFKLHKPVVGFVSNDRACAFVAYWEDAQRAELIGVSTGDARRLVSQPDVSGGDDANHPELELAEVA